LRAARAIFRLQLFSWRSPNCAFIPQLNRNPKCGGNGGYAEVSANPATHGVLDFTGRADLTAPKGATGTLFSWPGFSHALSGAARLFDFKGLQVHRKAPVFPTRASVSGRTLV
jgi:hypothetical protein